MEIIVSEMPKKPEECLFYREDLHSHYGYVTREYCSITNKSCSFENGKCGCLKIGENEKSITEKEEPMVFTVDPYRIIADHYVGKRPGYLALQCRCNINLYFPKQAEHGKYLLTCPKCGQPITYHT